MRPCAGAGSRPQLRPARLQEPHDASAFLAKSSVRTLRAIHKRQAYHDTVAGYFDEIRHHIDKLEEIVDDQIWPLPKYRELLFIR